MGSKTHTEVAHDWDRLLIDFLNAEIEHGLVTLAPDQPTTDAREHQQAVADALATVEFARQFERGIEDLTSRRSISERVNELERRAAVRNWSDAA